MQSTSDFYKQFNAVNNAVVQNAAHLHTTSLVAASNLQVIATMAQVAKDSTDSNFAANLRAALSNL